MSDLALSEADKAWEAYEAAANTLVGATKAYTDAFNAVAKDERDRLDKEITAIEDSFDAKHGLSLLAANLQEAKKEAERCDKILEELEGSEGPTDDDEEDEAEDEEQDDGPKAEAEEAAA